MTELVLNAPLIAPLALMAVWLLSKRYPGRAPAAVLAAARLASLITALAALSLALLALREGPVTAPLVGAGGLGLALRADALSAVMACLVSFVGLVVVQFSRNYLDGDDRHGLFMGRLCLTLAAVFLLVTAGNVAHLLLAWVVTSLCLHHLLVFYGDRPAAVTAARKKYIAARAGDAALLLAASVLYAACGTGDIAAIADAVRTGTADGPMPLWVAALAIAVAAALKSAQFPTHGWLIEVMETPTPVSALLHAGIINAGGFLVIRFADVMAASPGALVVLAVVGGFTALFGAVVMLTQTTVKGSLAYSTVAQMGFMLLQCGFGAFSAALVHIVAHSLYKAHAFLSAGSVVETLRPQAAVASGPPALTTLTLALGAALTAFAGVGFALQPTLFDRPGHALFGAVLVMGLTHWLARTLSAASDGTVILRCLVGAGLLAGVYFALQMGSAALLSGLVPAEPALTPLSAGLMALTLVSFTLVTLSQSLPWAGPAQAAFYAAASNGLYANALFNRLVGALHRRSDA